MAGTKTLAATARKGTGKGAARSVRREGRIPGVIYGGGDAAEPIALDYRELNKLIYAGHFLTTIFELDVGGVKQRVIPRDYQLDPIKDQPLHVDFLRLKPGASLRVQVPVHFINQDICPGIKRGGSLNIVRHTIEMRVPADAIPEVGHRRSRILANERFGAYHRNSFAGRLQADPARTRFHDRDDRTAARCHGRTGRRDPRGCSGAGRRAGCQGREGRARRPGRRSQGSAKGQEIARRMICKDHATKQDRETMSGSR